jgi:predicted dehydrogenase
MPSDLTPVDENRIPSDEPVGIIGAGPMAIEYAKAARHLGIPYRVYGRGADSAATFQAATGIRPGVGPLAQQLSTSPIKTAIVAVGVQDLATVATQLVSSGCNRILLEKPGAIDRRELETLSDRIRAYSGVQIFIAYNRRFYPGVQHARKIIEEDGGVTSIMFNFSEASWRIESLQKDRRVKENWLFANSSHVIDLAFFLSGQPVSLKARAQGYLSWHPAGSQFVGHGRLNGGGVFSYHADWGAPGSWSIEAMTKRHRLILRPLESLKLQPLGSFDIQNVVYDKTENERNIKLGLREMLEIFCKNKTDINLPTLQEQAEHFKLYESILMGND